MRFLKHLRSRSKFKDQELSNDLYYPTTRGADYIVRLPDDIIRRVLTFLCPHTEDDSYEPNERSMVGDGCMLCDLRDLSRCAQVRRSWYGLVQDQLYKSIRIDAVHYCELEEILAEKRRRKSRHGEPIDVPAVRLQLLCRTLWENKYLAATVKFLKLSYMTRETCKADLARTVSVLPNLLYVDLPDGFYTDEPSCHTLRGELQARCPEIRKMKYAAGSEQSFEMLQQGFWRHLEILELSRLRVEAGALRRILASLPVLHEMSLVDMPWMSDVIFQRAPTLPDFPALHSLSLENIPNITATGLKTYLSRPETREVFTTLSLNGTGITIADLYTVLWAATHLENLTFIQHVSHSLPLHPLPPLTSITLQTLHYEITTSESPHALHNPTDSYYAYLTTSLLNNSLPALRALYVRDPTFPESLTLAPPAPVFAEDGGFRPPPAARGFNQPLEVYTKGLAEHEWVFTSVLPSGPAGSGRRGSLSGGRPLSAYSASRGLGPQWGGEARKSVVVGNGFGGFLAVPMPDEEPAGVRRPSSASFGSGKGSMGSGHGRRESKHDLWR